MSVIRPICDQYTSVMLFRIEFVIRAIPTIVESTAQSMFDAIHPTARELSIQKFYVVVTRNNPAECYFQYSRNAYAANKLASYT